MMDEKEIVFNLQNILMSSRVTQAREENTIQEVCSLFTKRAPIMKEFPAGWFPCCPHCGGYLSERHYKHCPDCGQIINWEYCKDVQNDVLNVDISSLSISIKTYIILTNNSISTIKDILDKSLLDLLNLKRMTLRDVDDLLGALKEKNIDTSNWDKELNEINKR